MKYTKAKLEAMLSIQLDNLHAMHDLTRLMHKQNDIIEKATRSLEVQIQKFEKKHYNFAALKKPNTKKHR